MKTELAYAKIKSMTKIAIIEDNEIIGQMYRMKFEVEGFDVELANNGVDGIVMIENFAPDFLLLDLQMPKLDGAEVLKQIRAKAWGEDLPVLILTNTGKEEAPKELDELSISGYIVKAEMTPKQVVERVKQIIAEI